MFPQKNVFLQIFFCIFHVIFSISQKVTLDSLQSLPENVSAVILVPLSERRGVFFGFTSKASIRNATSKWEKENLNQIPKNAAHGNCTIEI